MALTKYKLGALTRVCTGGNENLRFGKESVKGISVNKEFVDTKADLDGVPLNHYTVVEPRCFAFVTVTSRNGNRISIAYNDTEESFVVSSFYVTFKLSEFGKSILLEEYLFLFFNRSEFDRYARRDSWGSAREYFYYENMSDVEIELPPIEVQKKYVDMYRAMVANQRSYERGLEDLKLVCDGCIDMLDNCYRMVGDFIEKNQKKNQDRKFTKAEVKGFNNDGQFIKPMRLFSGDVAKCTILQKNDFVYNLRVNSTIERLSIAINESGDFIVSPDYESFYIVKEEELYPYYLYTLLQRDSFAKKVLYTSFGSSTTYFRFNNLCEIKIPVPEYSKQVAIARIYRTYKERWTINEKLKAQIKDICPILIKGSLEEGANGHI